MLTSLSLRNTVPPLAFSRQFLIFDGMGLFRFTRPLLAALVAVFVGLQVGGFLDVPTFTLSPGRTLPAFHYMKFQGPFSSIPSFFDRLAKCKINQTLADGSLTLGIYFDDPRVVAADRLRFWLGFVGEKPTEASDDCKRDLKSLGPTIVGPSIETQMPIRHFLTPAIAPMLVYGPLHERVAQEGWTMHHPIELYDQQAARIVYVQPRDFFFQEW